MSGYLIAEEGPLIGLVIRLERGNEWILGRDPDEAGLVLEDPMVSRKHVICRLTEEGFLLENLSSVNPATQNGKIITEPVLLREGDIIQIGSTFFRFTEKAATFEEVEEEVSAPPVQFEEEDLSSIDFQQAFETRWLMKVVSGPNTGAEFTMHKSSIYIIGKDPNLCDIVFQDLSVSRQHARLSIDEEENVFMEDLGSRNGVLINGELITEKRQISSQDLIALGTTTFLIIDREQIRETIFSPLAAITPRYEAPVAEETQTPEQIAKQEALEGKPRDWKQMTIPKRHLILAAVFTFFILWGITAMFSLFKTEPIVTHEKNESDRIAEAIKNYEDVQFSYNPANGKLFLVGHVLTTVDKQELLYMLNNLPFVENIEDNVVVDEYVWQNMNALLMTNADWQAVTIQATSPGHFVMRGYLQTLEQAQELSDYVNMNFPYLDRLENQVVIEKNLLTQIQGMLIEKGFSAVTFELSNGEVVFSGRVDAKQGTEFTDLVNQLKGLRGVRQVKNFVVYTTAESSRIDLTGEYQITGYSKKDDVDFYVVISRVGQSSSSGRIVSKGDSLDGMMITSVQPNLVLLEKDGLKFKINYNQQ